MFSNETKIRKNNPNTWVETVGDYKKFMYNPENIGKCSICPNNEGHSGERGQYPCGQFNCWVLCHCK